MSSVIFFYFKNNKLSKMMENKLYTISLFDLKNRIILRNVNKYSERLVIGA